MRISSAASICIAVFLTLTLASAGLVFWSVSTTRFYSYRTNLAHKSYEQHLMLATHTYQLFKKYGDAMLIGGADRDAEKAKLIELIARDIWTIRGIIEDEIAIVGEEELEELELLDELEAMIVELIEKFESAELDENLAPTWFELSDILENDIDRNFKGMLEEALAEEVEEVEEAQADLAEITRLIQLLATLFSLVAVATTIAITMLYWRKLRVRLIALMKGVDAMRQGDLESPVEVSGTDELGKLSSLLNVIAEDLRTQRAELEDKNISLEQAVASRTRELERLLEEAKLNERNRRKLLADVSHELKTPLTIIQGESDVTLRTARTEEDYREALIRTRDAASHTATLVDDLLLIARKEAGQLTLSKEPTNISAFLREVVDLFPSAVTVQVPDPAVMASVDRLRLRQAILALLHNAKLYGGKQIWANLTVQDDRLCLSVSDDGAGLSEEDKAQVFDRFFRGSNAGGGYTKGTGLGLPIVRAIAQAHDGRVEITDRAEGGITFSMVVPFTQDEKATM